MTMLRRCNNPVSLFRELHELFPAVAGINEAVSAEQNYSGWAPKVDIKEDENGFVVYADIPGVDPGAIEIEMDANTLTIKGERKTEQEIKSKNYYRVECASGKFFRQFTLPESIDATKITAKNKRGVLTIHVPKAKAEKNARKIVVEDADS